MLKRLIFVILSFFFVSAHADQQAHLYLNPYYPQFTEQEQIPLLDSSLQTDFVRFAERRERVQKLWLEYMPQGHGLIEKDSFVLKRILDRSASRILKSEYFRKSKMGKSANAIKENMETDLEFKDEKNQNHKFDFKMALFQGQAFIQYSGFTKAQVRYDFSRGGQLAIVLQHDLGPTSAIGIETSLAGANQVQMVTLQHTW